MKKIFISLFLCFFIIDAMFAQSNEKYIVHLKNGEQIEYDINNVDFIEVIASDKSEGDSVANIGGTIGEAIDLNVSVLWADHNLGATYPTDCGKPSTWDSDFTVWGEGWRLPTEEEWQELYDSCKWTWTVCDGIGGRIITGTNGKSIFIPAAGVNISEQQFSNGNIGIYWTANNDDEEAETGVKAIGTYFDSANIYRIEYPVSNKFSVRLVKDKQ